MSKYCCFRCPSQDYSEKNLDDACPSCGHPYGFPLSSPPERIGDYKVLKPLGRGFYGAAYVAESGIVGRKFVVKISPVAIYAFAPFRKTPFPEEVRLHAALADAATHVVGITTAFDETVAFSDPAATRIECHVAVLDYVNGSTFNDFIGDTRPPRAASVCQIAIDLLRLRSELEASRLNHNDLHSENLIVERLQPASRRPDAIDPSLRVMAIDLGSVSDESKSTDERLGDLRFIAGHVDTLISRLLDNPDSTDDRNYRVALALQGVIGNLQSDAQKLRLPNPGDLINQIKTSFYRASHHWRPWDMPLNLKGFADHYNAQTLESWDVPRLLVDPAGRWLSETSRPGPQIVTGMRGCGKTMLLRALDIHARAALREKETKDDAIKRIQDDRFVGLFVSAQRLLELRKESALTLEDRLSRLFVAYALQGVRALMHLHDLDPSVILPDAHVRLSTVVSDQLDGAEALCDSVSLDDLEMRLHRTMVRTMRAEGGRVVEESPTEMFNRLANALRDCSVILGRASVFYLLDDVSTRYLDLDRIEELLSALLFQSPVCAFKFTSEWQTIELGLRSPGRNHPIRVGRDLTVFDLGADVLKEISEPGAGGKAFIGDILRLRAGIHPQHPGEQDPKRILGDVSLEQVAREIASSSEGGGLKKRVYRGISCLTSVCVGDIGDIIKLYEEILSRNGGRNAFPIEEGIQSECFQEMSARRLYDLNRSTAHYKNLKNHALAFAQTAHDLLVRSYRNASDDKKERIRLRQYSSIYVRVTTDEESSQKQQIERLRDLIDAGVFVFSGGAPRSKTKDSDPILQFILSYRKIYGLASYIGLADRDRFELSGKDLSDWLGLEDVAAAKEVLRRNQTKEEIHGPTAENCAGSEQQSEPGGASGPTALQRETAGGSPRRQADLFSATNHDKGPPTPKAWAESLSFSVSELSKEELAGASVQSVFTGLGFEDRTCASNELLSQVLEPGVVHAVRYSVEGHAAAILDMWRRPGTRIVESQYQETLESPPRMDGLALVDVSGLAKPLIFKTVRSQLLTEGRVLVCHASAEAHYPLQEDLEKLFAVDKSQDPVAFLEELAALLKGEEGPYKDVRLLDEISDPSRNRALLAFASPKHERLFSLLNSREFDQIEVIAPEGDRPRAMVAANAAKFICQNFPNSSVTRFCDDDLGGLIDYLDSRYLEIYGAGGANLELGLTGTKTQAIAAAVLSSARKVSQAWYLSPKTFDEKRFSSGVGPIRLYDIRVPGRIPPRD